MNEIIFNGAEIKQRIISEINNASQNIYLAMAWFTDKDIANSIITAKNRNVTIDIILSSNIQNDPVKQLFIDANISVHAFSTGDDRGVMHHKFCLIDNKISINGSYNYSYNASTNNVENIHVSDNIETYRQLFSEFERLKYNIDHNIAVNNVVPVPITKQQTVNAVDSFSQQLHNLVYLSTDINAEEYNRQGYDKSKESRGSIEIFKSEYDNIKEKIRIYAADDSLSSKKNILTSNVSTAFDGKKTDLEIERSNEISTIKTSHDLEKRHLNDKNLIIKQEVSLLESGNPSTGEKGLLQLNKEIETNKFETRTINENLVIQKFKTPGTILFSAFLTICVFYLSIFFASALYKVFFEGNIIRASLEAGINPGLPQLVDANAIIKIFKQQGTLFGVISALIFLFPVALTNLKVLGSKNRTVNIICFWVGLIVFDVLVSGMVAINNDKIESLLRGQESTMQFWEVIKHGEFYMIFIFGMLPLFITHYLIDYIIAAYQKSRKEIVDGEKTRKLQILERDLIELNSEKAGLSQRIKEKEENMQENAIKVQNLERDLNDLQNQVDAKYSELQRTIKTIFDEFNAKISSGRIFTEEILSGVISAYKSGFIGYLPEFYAEVEVASRVREIDQIINNQ